MRNSWQNYKAKITLVPFGDEALAYLCGTRKGNSLELRIAFTVNGKRQRKNSRLCLLEKHEHIVENSTAEFWPLMLMQNYSTAQFYWETENSAGQS